MGKLYKAPLGALATGCLLLVAVVAWTAVAALSPALPSPISIASTLWQDMHTGRLGTDIAHSAIHLGLGIAIGATAGLGIGYIIGRSRLRRLGLAFCSAVFALCLTFQKGLQLSLALMLGTTLMTTVIPIAIAVAFPTALGVIAACDASVTRRANAQPSQSLARAALTSATLFLALRLAAILACVTLVSAESTFSTNGIGSYLLTSIGGLMTNQAIGGGLLLFVATILLVALLGPLQRALMRANANR